MTGLFTRLQEADPLAANYVAAFIGSTEASAAYTISDRALGAAGQLAVDKLSEAFEMERVPADTEIDGYTYDQVVRELQVEALYDGDERLWDRLQKGAPSFAREIQTGVARLATIAMAQDEELERDMVKAVAGWARNVLEIPEPPQAALDAWENNPELRRDAVAGMRTVAEHGAGTPEAFLALNDVDQKHGINQLLNPDEDAA